MLKILSKIDIQFLIILSLTLGLAPFNPPHIYQKIILLLNGQLNTLVDWGDLFFHGSPWILLFLKVCAQIYFFKKINKKNISEKE